VRILIIEDEKKTAAFLAKGLREAGLHVDLAGDGGAGLNAARDHKFDLLIVDVMLPGKDGWAVVEADVLPGGVGADAPLANAIAGREYLRALGV